MSGPGHVARFDAFKLSARGGSISGSLDARSLPNVADSLAPGDDPVRVDWTIEGLASAEGRPALAIAIEAEVPLVCQRCLGRMAWKVSQSTEVLLAHDEGELASLDEGSEGEVILADRPLDAATLVEDELVLTLPFAPRHEGGCAAARQ
ncbi:MAG: DUF177 domain-containing protein [Burkholderiales bacterium]